MGPRPSPQTTRRSAVTRPGRVGAISLVGRASSNGSARRRSWKCRIGRWCRQTLHRAGLPARYGALSGPPGCRHRADAALTTLPVASLVAMAGVYRRPCFARWLAGLPGLRAGAPVRSRRMSATPERILILAIGAKPDTYDDAAARR